MGLVARKLLVGAFEHEQRYFAREPGISKSLPDSPGMRLVVLQMKCSPSDGVTPQKFQRKVDSLMHRAEAEGHIARDKPTLIVFPELVALELIYMGSFLASLLPLKELAIPALLLGNLPSVLWQAWQNGLGLSKLPKAFFLALDRDIRKVYEGVFSSAARDHGVYIAAGSAPITVDGKGPFNASYVFGPDGKLLPTTQGKPFIQKKVNLTEPEKSLLQFEAGNLNELLACGIPLSSGTVCFSVAICLDIFDPRREKGMRPPEEGDVRRTLHNLKVVLVAVPSANSELWEAILQEERITQAEAWMRGSKDAVITDPVLQFCGNAMAVGSPIPGITFSGKSATYDDSGVVKMAKSSNKEEIISTDIIFTSPAPPPL